MTKRTYVVRKGKSERWTYEFKAAEGSRLSDDDAKRIGPELKAIGDRDGNITPEAVVARARDPKSALHRYFTWDIQKAAEERWLDQARYLIRSVKILVKFAPHDKPKEVRAFVRHENIGNGYRPIIEVFSNADHRNLIVARALEELKTWRQRYQEISEFAELFAAIDAVLVKSAHAKKTGTGLGQSGAREAGQEIDRRGSATRGKSTDKSWPQRLL